jgi:hypothetical protein
MLKLITRRVIDPVDAAAPLAAGIKRAARIATRIHRRLMHP